MIIIATVISIVFSVSATTISIVIVVDILIIVTVSVWSIISPYMLPTWAANMEGPSNPSPTGARAISVAPLNRTPHDTTISTLRHCHLLSFFARKALNHHISVCGAC